MTTEHDGQEVCQEQPTVESVVAEMKVASLEDLKTLPEIRKASAVPFQIPGTPFTVMLAKCSGITKYVMNVQQMLMVQTDDADERLKYLTAMNNAIIKSCVIQPVLDEDAIQAINEYDGSALEMLLAKCVELSSDGKIKQTDMLENFG